MDVTQIRKDFPFLEKQINGKHLIYFDNAATTQKPRQVLNTIQIFYSEYNSAINRSSHEAGNTASSMYRLAHENAAKFIGANVFREIIFVRNSTEAVNLVCYSLMLSKDKSIKLSRDDEIIVPVSEHHSDIVPWQRLREFIGANVIFTGIKRDGRLDIDEIKKNITKHTRLICCAHVSNVLGTINPVKEIAEIAHNAGALFLTDGTQSVPHMPVNVRDIDCDFFVFSGHKMLAPAGIGVLYGKKELLEKMPPFITGGGMIKDVTTQNTRWSELPWKFEAGTPDACGAIAFAGATVPGSGYKLEGAMDYLSDIGMGNVLKHETELADYAIKKLRAINEIVLYTPAESTGRCGIVSFNIKKDGEIVDPHTIAGFLSDDGIMVRSGGLCAFPLVKSLSPEGVVRASFYIYNTKEEIDVFIDSLDAIISKKIL